MSEMPGRVRTFVPGLDEILGGGLVEGRVTLLAGHLGAGKIASARALERERDVMKRRILVLKERGSIHDERIRYIDFKEREALICDQ